MCQAEWLDENNRITLTGVEKILIKSTEVGMVELMTISTGAKEEVSDGRPQSTNTTTALAASAGKGGER
jgi:hypothetical protein